MDIVIETRIGDMDISWACESIKQDIENNYVAELDFNSYVGYMMEFDESKDMITIKLIRPDLSKSND